MTVPTISNLPTVPATSDPNFETEAPALFNHIKNTFVSEMNSAISFINSSTFDATVEFKNSNFTAARNFLYMIDTSSTAVSVTLPANPSTGDQLLLMDQKRNFGTNNLTIGRNSQNINGAASDVVSKSTGALIRCIFQSSYGWTVDLYEGEWESGTSAGDLVYNGGNVGIGTSAPTRTLEIVDNSSDGSGGLKVRNFLPVIELEDFSGGKTQAKIQQDALAMKIGPVNSSTTLSLLTENTERLHIDRYGKVGIGTSSPSAKLHATGNIVAQNATNPTISANDNGTLGASDKSVYMRYDTSNDVGVLGSFHNGTGAKNLVLNQLGGNVGIGTSAPSSPLHVKAANNIIMSLQSSDATVGNLYFNFRNDDGDEKGWIGYGSSTTDDFGIFNNQSRDLNLGTSGTTRLQIKSAGDVEVKTGNLVIGTAGKGIDFSASSHFGGTGGGTGMSSELFDSYEEGTFKPKFTDNQSTPNQASGSFSGTYTKIGRLVTISCFGLNLNTSGMTSTDPLKIRDLPFVNESTLSRYGSVRLQDVSFSGYCNVQISVGVSVLEIMENISGSGTNVLSVADVTTVGNTADILLTLTYETS